MTQMLTKPQFIDKLNKIMDAALSSEEARMNELSPEAGQLASYMRQTIMRPAKRTRPYLFYLTYQGLNPNDQDFPWDLAVAIELYHQFLLIHDDVMDNDTVRHGAPNVAGRYMEHLGTLIPAGDKRKEVSAALAILAGDLCFSVVQEQIASSGVAPDQKLALTRSLHQVTERELAGEQLDILFGFRDINETSMEQILTAYDHKTTAYTLELPLTWATQLSNISSAHAKLWIQFAIKVGRAYQISDDIIGLFSDSRATGKPIGGDIRQNKKTAVLRLAYERLGPDEWQQVQAMLGRESTDAEMKQLIEFLRSHGIEDEAIALAETFISAARKTLSQIQVAEASRTELVALVDGLAGRKA